MKSPDAIGVGEGGAAWCARAESSYARRVGTPYRTPAKRDEKEPPAKRIERSGAAHLVEAALAIVFIELVLRSCH